MGERIASFRKQRNVTQVQLAEVLGVSQLERSIERISELPEQKHRFVIEMLETVLAQANV